jgi:hypothetical protein
MPGRSSFFNPKTRLDAPGDRAVLLTVERYSRFLDPILQRISTQDPAQASQIEQFQRSNPRCQ